MRFTALIALIGAGATLFLLIPNCSAVLAATNLNFNALRTLAVWYVGNGVSLPATYVAALPFLGISFGATTLWGYAMGFALQRVERTANV